MNPIAALLNGIGKIIERQTMLDRLENKLGHPTPEKRRKNTGKRGMGYTKASHEENKKRRKMAARSRRINWR